MSDIGSYVICMVMLCAVASAFAATRDDDSPLGKAFFDGIRSLEPIFFGKLVGGIIALGLASSMEADRKHGEEGRE